MFFREVFLWIWPSNTKRYRPGSLISIHRRPFFTWWWWCQHPTRTNVAWNMLFNIHRHSSRISYIELIIESFFFFSNNKRVLIARRWKTFPKKKQKNKTKKELELKITNLCIWSWCVCFALVLLSIVIVGFDDVQPRQMTFDSQRLFPMDSTGTPLL